MGCAANTDMQEDEDIKTLTLVQNQTWTAHTEHGRNKDRKQGEWKGKEEREKETGGTEEVVKLDDSQNKK